MSSLNAFQSFASKENKPAGKGNRAVIYTRISHANQEDNTSLESQLKFCEEFARRKGFEVVEHFGGQVESAKTDDRKEFNRMLTYLRRSKSIGYVIVYSYERFSRSGVGGAQIAEDLLKQHGVVTLAVMQELDPTTASGSFQQKIYFLFSQMDNELRRDKAVRGMSELLLKGYTPFNIPRGYVNLNRGQKAIDQEVVLNDVGKKIRKAFHWKAQGMSNVDITKKLKKLGLNLDRRRLTEIFSNPYYCGVIVNSLIPGQVVEGKHEAAVSKALFLKVNEVVAEKRSHPTVHQKLDDNLPLKRFMSCAECETPMTGYLVRKKGLYYYKCRTKGCKHNVSAKHIHEEFASLLYLFQVDESDQPLVKEAVIAHYDLFFEEHKENQRLVKKQLAEIATNIDTLEERYVLGKVSDELYTKFLKRYTNQRDEILKGSVVKEDASSNLENCLKIVMEICLNPRQWWKSSSLRNKMWLQKTMFPEGITVTRENRRVRTNRVNSFFAPIAQLAKHLRETKNGQLVDVNQLSAIVGDEGFEPPTPSV